MLNALFLLKLINGVINSKFVLDKLYIRVPDLSTRYYKFINFKYYTMYYANFVPFRRICNDFNNIYPHID